MTVPKTRPDVSEDVRADAAHTPRPLSLVENIVLTLKLLAGAGVLVAVLWAANLLTAPN